MLPRNQIYLIQEIANNSWPAKHYYSLNGWILRFTAGATSRANSVLPLRYWGKNLEEDIRIVEEAYSVYNLPAKFMLNDYYKPESLHEELSKNNYHADPDVYVMGAPLTEIRKLSLNLSYKYAGKPEMTQEWYKAFISLTTHRSKNDLIIMGEVMDRIRVPKRMFFSACIEDQIIGVVLGTLERSYLGILDLIVDPIYRQQGIATSLLQKVVEWAEKQGGKYLYLQVVAENSEAVTLYRKLNMKKLFNYFYMTKSLEE
jgi:ribosomal protein S18 acetylase RimI-like enzyme